ncbi:MAG: hypothetical protein ACOH2E_07720 [Candidatus Paracaedibacter sp.]
MSNEKFTPLLSVANLFESQEDRYTSSLWPSHPFIINVSVTDEPMTFLRLKFKPSRSAGLSRPGMENIALWLKKCLLMLPTTRKSGLRLLTATG